jgi:hypothetical protein
MTNCRSSGSSPTRRKGSTTETGAIGAEICRVQSACFGIKPFTVSPFVVVNLSYFMLVITYHSYKHMSDHSYMITSYI